MALINFFPKAKSKPLLIAFILFILTLSVYKFIYPQPRNWYNHYYYLAQSFSQFKLDVPTLPDYYQDKTVFQGKIYLPFPPVPSLMLLPSLAINLTQQQTSIIIGSINVALCYLLVGSFPLSIFFAFGTVHFWSSVVGTTWYFAHVVSVFFVLLSLISHRSKNSSSPFLSGLFLGLATLSRLPIIAGALFFFLEFKKSPKRLIYFSLGFIPIILSYFVYNWLRFDNPFISGYLEVYKYYLQGNIPYTFFHATFSNFPHFHHLDPRNIPLHLFNFLIFPPIIQNKHLVPSPFGMGIVFTTPLLLLTLWPRFKNSTEKNAYFTALAIAVIDFLHFSQGWVQFGYRFLLDFLPFLLIILATRFKPRRLFYLLLLISIIVNTWGTYQAINLGW